MSTIASGLDELTGRIAAEVTDESGGVLRDRGATSISIETAIELIAAAVASGITRYAVRAAGGEAMSHG